jgi:hypothetical protein
MTSRSALLITPERDRTHGVIAGALEGYSAHLLCREAPVVRCAGFGWGREEGRYCTRWSLIRPFPALTVPSCLSASVGIRGEKGASGATLR